MICLTFVESYIKNCEQLCIKISTDMINIKYSLQKFVALLMFLLGGLISYGQYQVMATVIDEEGQPEEYATYRIFEIPDTTRQIIGNVTKSDGIIDSQLPKPGEYRIVISAMMKSPITIDFNVDSNQPVADLGILNTELAGKTLNEVTVTAQRPLVTKEIDRIGYDVQADGDASTSNLREILKKVPLVSVDEEGNIKVNGSDNFKIYRNGRPNNAYTKNAKDIFAAIPASTIKKIEVITDPGAREDAESSGVILNIVTTSTVSMAGVTGNIGLSYQTNTGPQANAFIMTQYKKFTLSGSGGFYKMFKKNSWGEQHSRFIYEETDDRQDIDSEYHIGSLGGWFNAEASLELDSLNLITSSVNGYIGKNAYDIFSQRSMFDSNGEILNVYNQNSYYRKNGYTDIDFNLDYQRSTRLQGETITLSYRLSHTRQNQDQTTDFTVIEGDPFNYSSILSDFDLKFFEHTFQVDWSRPLGKHYKLDTGAKYILRSSHSINHQNLVDVGQTYDDFKHTFNIFGIYADARATYGSFTARAGVRYEYSRLQADFLTGNQKDFHANLNDVVPNASVAWNVNDASTWKLTYNRRIQRPGISYLNPAVSISPNNVSYGNPDLKSATLDNLLVNYSLIKLKFNLDLTLTYSMTNNGMGNIMWTDSDNVTYSTYGNKMHQRNLTLSAFYQWQLGEKTSWMLNGNLEWGKFGLDNGSKYVSLARITGYFYTRVQQKLPWDLTLSLGVNYFSGWIGSPYFYSSNPFSAIGYSVGLRRSFLKDKRLDVNLSFNNIGLNDRKQKMYYLNDGRDGHQLSIQHNRQQVMLGISWRFGNLRAQVKKTEKSISNDDLQGRKND